MLMIQAKMYHKSFFQKKPEYSPEQKRYLDYYNVQVKRGRFRVVVYSLIPLLLLLLFIVVFTNFQFTTPSEIAYYILVVSCQVLAILYTIRYEKKGFPLFMCAALLISESFILWCCHGANGLFVAILILLVSFIIPFINGITSLLPDTKYRRYAKKIVPYIKERQNKEHTAVILPHDVKRIGDHGDTPVLPLLEGLTKYDEEFQVYLCLTAEDVEAVLTNPLVKRIWVFGHGKRGGCSLTGGLFDYTKFMLEQTDSEWKVRTITPKEYIYQCHCNREGDPSLADFLIPKKGYLDEEIDDLLNYFDTGIVDMKIESKKNYRLLAITQPIYRFIHTKLHLDMNYMSEASAEYVIDCYLTHLEKKQKISE